MMNLFVFVFVFLFLGFWLQSNKWKVLCCTVDHVTMTKGLLGIFGPTIYEYGVGEKKE